MINWVKNNTKSDIFLIDESYNLKNINIRATGLSKILKDQQLLMKIMYMDLLKILRGGRV